MAEYLPPPDEEDEDEDDDESEEVDPRDLWRIYRFLKPFARPHRGALSLLILLLAIETAFNFSFPFATMHLLDEGLIGHVDEDGRVERDFTVVVVVLVYFAIASVVMAGLGLACDYLNARTFVTMILDIRSRLFQHLQTLSMPFFTRTQAGAVLSRFSGDLVALESTLVTMIPWCLVPLLEVTYSVVVMLIINVWLGLLACIVFPLTLLGPRVFAARAFAASYEKRQREGVVLGNVQENVSAQTVVKAFGLQRQAQTRFDTLNRSWLMIAFRFHFLGALVERTSHTGVYLVHVLIFGVGAYWTYWGIGEMTVGKLVAFEAIFLSMGYELTYVTQFIPSLAQAAGSIHHLDDLFDLKPIIVDPPNAVPLPRLERDIVFEHVSFRYGDEGFALKDFDVRIGRGSFVAFVGASGSGKSTILSLLLRFYDPAKGAILIDGRDVRSVTQESLRSQMGMVFQDSFLFNASILDNLRLGRPDATREEVENAARAAEMHDFIAGLPDGYDTNVGERGSQLSGGQRQRLAIARALLRDPAILILDEATSALDYATESALNATLRKVAQQRTVITVTHRLSAVTEANPIVVLDHGRVVERGTHEELLERQGTYAALWWTQNERELDPAP